LRSRWALILLGTSFPSLLLSITCVILVMLALLQSVLRWMWKSEGLKQQPEHRHHYGRTRGTLLATGQTIMAEAQWGSVRLEVAIGRARLHLPATNGRATAGSLGKLRRLDKKHVTTHSPSPPPNLGDKVNSHSCYY
jgi:hypothetical protein